VPLPWAPDGAAHGFSTGTPWLPLPAEWAGRSVAAQLEDPGSSLALHRAALGARRESAALREGSFEWVDAPAGVLAFRREAGGERVVCIVNVEAGPFSPPAGEVLLASEPGDVLRAGSAAWIREES
jgi:alpha-glucosidase